MLQHYAALAALVLVVAVDACVLLRHLPACVRRVLSCPVLQASTPTGVCRAGQSLASPCTSRMASSCCRWWSWTYVGPQKSGATVHC